MLPIDPTAAAGSGEWQVGSVGGLTPSEATTDPALVDGSASTGGFGNVLTTEVGKLSQLQDQATTASQALADGTATDPTAVVMAVEKAQLAMQLAGQLRSRGVEAMTEIFHTQV
ncbi:MAG: flagellar hook-basal body complex protein FliE [Conexibacter sp.]|jgi:flagellar hook-basal body complex protein FliE|nr:flagellar hook-basal body complex protein FliE [Conexibacter sp.]